MGDRVKRFTFSRPSIGRLGQMLNSDWLILGSHFEPATEADAEILSKIPCKILAEKWKILSCWIINYLILKS